MIVTLATVVRRLKRHYAARGQVFATVQGRDARQRYGRWFVRSETGLYDVRLEAIRDLALHAYTLGVLSVDEMIYEDGEETYQRLSDMIQRFPRRMRAEVVGSLQESIIEDEQHAISVEGVEGRQHAIVLN